MNKIEALRKIMQDKGIQACIIPTTDPHISEYTPLHWETRKYLSGFTGSAGTLVVTLNKAGLWTDSRYFIQAEKELKSSGIDLFKIGLDGVPSFSQWLSDELKKGDTIGIEGVVFDASEAQSLLANFGKEGININTDFAPWDMLWTDRPAIPTDKAFILPEKLSGQAVQEKINTLLDRIKEEGADATVLASLDQIAWLFNMRGTDISFNPVAVSYAYVSEEETVLFIKPEKLTHELIEYLTDQGVIIADYDKIFSYAASFPKDLKVLLTPNKINYKLWKAIEEHTEIVVSSIHPVDYLKSIKNEVEIEGMRNAMRKDGAALVRFLIWLEESLSKGEKITEIDVANKLTEYRSQQSLYFSESFSTIAGYAEHGAIVHYSANEESNAVIEPKGLLLVDSGAQYFDGTTDITRTIAVGEVTNSMKKDYTNILKGNIRLSMAKYPKGTVGMQLDILARQFIWQEGQNYLHGTGHGIGSFLNVHEGPQSIRMNYNPVALMPGMITSNEPGLYKGGEYGIRIENLILTIKADTTSFGDYYAFETLTLCPIDLAPVDYSLLAPEEISWLNQYHEKVYKELSSLLTPKEQEWLREKTSIKSAE